MPRRLLIPALLVGSLACERAPEAVAPAESRPVGLEPAHAVTLATYLPADTIAKASGVLVDTIELNDLPHERFMAPFYLNVRDLGDGLSGSIRLDSVVVMRLGRVAPGGEARKRIMPVPGSRLIVTLTGTGARSVELRIEAAIQPAPVIRVTSPARGAMLRRGGLDMLAVDVSGSACHGTSPIAALSVNGVAQPVSGTELCAAFTTPVESPWGMTTVVIDATTASGRSARRVQSFLRSRYWSTPALEIDGDAAYDTLVDIGYAAVARWEQSGFQKLTSLVPAAINAAPTIGGSFPTSLELGGCAAYEWQVTRGTPSSHIDEVILTVTSQNTLNVRVQYDITIPFTAHYCGFNIISMNGSGTIAATNATLDGDLGLGVVPGTGGVEWELDNINTSDLSTATIDLVGFNSVASDHVAALRTELRSELGDAAMLDAAASIEEGAQFGLAFTRLLLPASGLSDIGVALTHTAHSARFASGGVDIGFRAQTAPLVPRGGSPPARGSIRTRTAFTYQSRPGDVNEYVGDDFVNQVLWSAWQSGWFDALDMESISGRVGGLSAALYSSLPPVMTPGDGNHVRFGWGDVELNALVDRAHYGLDATSTGMVEVTAFGSVTVDARVRYDSIAHRLVLREVSAQAAIEVTSPPSALLDEAALRDALGGALEAAARNRLRLAFEAVPLLEADLGGMFDAPPGTMLDLHDATSARTGRFQRVGGSFSP